MEEPSVLDYVKSKINPRTKKIEIPWGVEDYDLSFAAEAVEIQRERVFAPTEPLIQNVPWKLFTGLGVAVFAQLNLESSKTKPVLSAILYGLAALLIGWAYYSKGFELPQGEDDNTNAMPISTHQRSFFLSLPFVLLAFLAFGGNQFNTLNLFLWIVGVGLSLVALWVPKSSAREWLNDLREKMRKPRFAIHFTPFHLLLLVCALLVVYFRFARLEQIPGEMFSDHAEKLLDVADVLDGNYSIFFPRNTGREAIQMYLTAAIAVLCNTGLSFISLKLGTALAGLLTLPYIYLLGKELGNRWVGLLAFILAGVAYWPNVISRVGLRFPLYPLFTAPTLFYFVRGLRRSNRNDFILAGVALGLGLHGYSPFRFVPILIVLGTGIYLLHRQSKDKRYQAVWALCMLALVAFLIFLPLARYALSNPQMFGYRALSRLSSSERSIPGAAWQIFFENLWKAEIMPWWDNGNIWVHSIPGRPALDAITAVFYLFGSVWLMIRYVQKRRWQDIFLLLSVPLLMMPSILSLAFPEENPSLNRTGGAIIPVFIIAAVGFEGFLGNIFRKARTQLGKSFTLFLGLMLISGVIVSNYDLVFRVYAKQFMAGAWNTSQIGKVIRGFADSVGSPEHAYVVPYPYWVDTRLVGINAGYPLKDYALWPESFQETLSEPGAKLFIVKMEDELSLESLRLLYPKGSYYLQTSEYEGKEFWVFLVPAEPGNQPEKKLTPVEVTP